MSKNNDIKEFTPLKELITLLKAIDDDPLLEDDDGQSDKYIINSLASSLACDALIDFNGKNIWENHTILRKAGFYVFPGERDGFGWLTGCIQTKKGIIVYG
jgi:hypothetical protein